MRMERWLSPEERWALKCLTEENAHDTEERRIEVLDTLIENGLARVERYYSSRWGGRLHKVREVTLSARGLAAHHGANNA
jgi:hypothetical protein